MSTFVQNPDVPAEQADCEPLRFERRQCDRWGIDGVATAFELAGPTFGQMHTLRTIDYSDAGIGAISDSALHPGTAVSIGFQSPGYMAKRGVVMRCTPCGDGYRVAVGFEQRLAA